MKVIASQTVPPPRTRKLPPRELPPADPGCSGARYAALGDSFASGYGAGSYYPPIEQGRSPDSYPGVLADRLHLRHFALAARRGAGIADVLAEQTRPLSDRTDLVTVTVGGNDIGFSREIRRCLLAGDAEGVALIRDVQEFVRTRMPDRLHLLYTTLRERAPNAEVLVLGYPCFFEPGASTVMFSAPKQAVLNDVVDTLDEVIEDVATRAGAAFLDVREAFGGHGLGSEDPWITDPAGPDRFHPNRAGQLHGYLEVLAGHLLAARSHHDARRTPDGPFLSYSTVRDS